MSEIISGSCLRKRARLARGILMPFLLVSWLVPMSGASGQVGDTSGVTYPGWKSSDKVVPGVSLVVSFDSVAALWRYNFVISNGATAVQEIADATLSFSGQSLTATAPSGWDAMIFDTASAVTGVSFITAGESFLTVGSDTIAAPTTFQIAAGSQNTFSITSRYPPGQARWFVRGYSGVPYLPDSVVGIIVAPDDTTDSQRGWSLGPTKYTTVITQGTQEATDLARANRFLSFMNVDTLGTTLRAPTPIAIKFDNGSDGDYVIRPSFRALLNNVDVTSSFHPSPAGGADLVAVFTLGSGSPLVLGSNTLKTFVSGLPSTFSVAKIPSVEDADTIVFSVQQ